MSYDDYEKGREDPWGLAEMMQLYPFSVIGSVIWSVIAVMAHNRKVAC